MCAHFRDYPKVPCVHRRASPWLVITVVHGVVFGLALDPPSRLQRRFRHQGVGASDWRRTPGAGAESRWERLAFA